MLLHLYTNAQATSPFTGGSANTCNRTPSASQSGNLLLVPLGGSDGVVDGDDASPRLSRPIARSTGAAATREGRRAGEEEPDTGEGEAEEEGEDEASASS